MPASEVAPKLPPKVSDGPVGETNEALSAVVALAAALCFAAFVVEPVADAETSAVTPEPRFALRTSNCVLPEALGEAEADVGVEAAAAVLVLVVLVVDVVAEVGWLEVDDVVDEVEPVLAAGAVVPEEVEDPLEVRPAAVPEVVVVDDDAGVELLPVTVPTTPSTVPVTAPTTPVVSVPATESTVLVTGVVTAVTVDVTVEVRPPSRPPVVSAWAAVQPAIDRPPRETANRTPRVRFLFMAMGAFVAVFEDHEASAASPASHPPR